MARTGLAAGETAIDNAVGVARWPATVAIVLVGGSYFFLSSRFTVGPRWGILAIIATLLIPLWVLRLRGMHRWTHAVGLALNGILTLAVASSAALLLYRLGEKTEQALPLLRDAALVWGANIVVFALWYWNLDAGGPAQRHPGKHASQDFSFPQQQQDDDGIVEGWSPGFLDYLFLAFNTSTAFSPTDTLVLSRQMKVLMMAQALISLIVIAVLAARAINTIT
ncbi:MAG TPA: hypothetical protein VIL85_08220 [Thermomicrobiales bacterium]|jgi:hypothetical protein